MWHPSKFIAPFAAFFFSASFAFSANLNDYNNLVNAIEHGAPEEGGQLLHSLEGEVLTGAYEQLLWQLITFSEQVDERLNAHENREMKMALNAKGRIVLASTGKGFSLVESVRSPWVGWTQLLGSMGRQKPSGGNNTYDSRSAASITGFDRALDQNWRLGGALLVQNGLLDWDQFNGRTRADTLAGLFYGSYDLDHWFARSQVGGGGSWVKNHRDIPLGLLGLPTLTATSKPTLPFFHARGSTGYHFHYKGVRLTSSAGVFYVHTVNHPFSEKGADDFNLRVYRSDQDNLEVQANLEASYVAIINDRPVTLRASYGIGYETLDKQVTLNTGFLAFPDLMTFNVLSTNPGRLHQIAEVGMNVEVVKNVRFRLDYLGLFARHQYNHTGAVTVKVVF